MQRRQRTEALTDQHRSPLSRDRVGQGGHQAAGEGARVRRVGGVPLVASWPRGDHGDAHRRQRPGGDERCDVRREPAVGVHLRAVVADQERQRVGDRQVGRRPDLDVEPPRTRPRERQRRPVPGARLEPQPGRRAVGRERDPRVVSERSTRDPGVGGVGAEIAIDVQEVLEPVDRQAGQPHFPAALDLVHRGVAEVEVCPDRDVGGLVVGIGAPDDDILAVHLGHQHPENLANTHGR